jgi:hypothetical protein
VKASLLIYMSGMLSIIAGSASAEPWSIEPRLGVSANYDTNPALIELNPSSEEHIAALVSLPLRYDGDGIVLSLSPSARISDSHGYSSLASNYAHVDGSAQFTSDVGSTTVHGELARDSSLYHVGGLVNGLGVRRDSASTGADWTRSLTERSSLQLDLDWTRVSYGQNPDLLTDYKYLSAGPMFTYALTERDTVKVLSNLGRYQSLNGITESTSANLQLGFTRQLNELWTLSTTAGYSRSTNTEKFFAGPFFLGSLSSSLNGAVYAATLTHQNEHLNFSGGVSRSLQPLGFAYLSQQDTVNLAATYVRSERWDFLLTSIWNKALRPVPLSSQATLGAAGTEVRYAYVQLTAEWHWTPLWIISMHATRITQQSAPPPYSAASSGVSVDIVRQFLRADL